MRDIDLLESIAGFTLAHSERESPKRNIALATIDPAYVSGNPKVTFDGEDTLSEKLYPHATSYTPRAGDRVVMLPIGSTFLISGSIADGTYSVPRIAAGRVLVSMTTTLTPPWGGTANRGSATVTFPTGRFNAVPRISAVCDTTLPFHRNCGISSMSATGFTVTVDSTGTGQVAVEWVAVRE